MNKVLLFSMIGATDVRLLPNGRGVVRTHCCKSWYLWLVSAACSNYLLYDVHLVLREVQDPGSQWTTYSWGELECPLAALISN